MSNLDYEYLITVDKLDKIFYEKKKKLDDDISKLNYKFSENDCPKKLVKKKYIFDREDDLFQEIYIKFDGDYSELVEDYVQTLIKLEKKRVKFAYIFGFLFCICSLSILFLFSNITVI